MPSGHYLRTPEQQQRRIAKMQERNRTKEQREKSRAGLLSYNQQTGTKTSQYSGVFYNKQSGRWVAAIGFQGKNYTRQFPGTAEGERQAERQYQEWRAQVQMGHYPTKEEVYRQKDTEYTINEAALYLDISVTHIYNMRSLGKLGGRRIGGHLVFTKDELDTYKALYSR